MTEFERHDVERLAQLARLRLSEEEIARFTGQLARILSYADAVQGVQTVDVPPTSHPLRGSGAHLRDDRPSESLARDEVLSGAPDADAGLFKVPRVL